MNLNEEQYERVARWLDGESLELSPQELAAAAEIRRQLGELGERLDVQMPARVVGLGSTKRPRLRLVARRALAPFALAAAAAVMLLALPTFMHHDAATTDDEDLVAFFTMDDSELSSVADELGRAGEELMAASGPLDKQIDEIQQSIEEFWLEAPKIAALES
jgi:hypothetical protein